MNISDFKFEVPSRLIAVSPLEKRSMAKLMIVNRATQTAEHARFLDLPQYLGRGSLIVFNNSSVIPARFFGKRKSGAALEGLLVQAEGMLAEVWLKGKVLEGEVIELDGVGPVQVLKREGKRAVLNIDQKLFAEKLKQVGVIPLPPYIVAEREARGLVVTPKADTRDYQTVFAHQGREGFSVAAPTASLHFDADLLNAFQTAGFEYVTLSLDVGEGTFAPVESDSLEAHTMHSETVEIAPTTWKKIVAAKKEGRPIVAVGTTVMRSLESAIRRLEENLSTDRYRTNLFIKPPFKFKVVDSLITNFHWPDSTLIVLAATFMEASEGRCPEKIQHVWKKYYEEAVQQNYRFFSYGDGMLIL